MSKHGTKVPKELRFVCPTCHHDGLALYAEGYTEVEHIYDDGTTILGSTEIAYPQEYVCRNCHYQLELKEGEDVSDWLMTHCSQGEPDAGESEDQASEVPPSDSVK
jgi:competence CoiA-like predicted nuclease